METVRVINGTKSDFIWWRLDSDWLTESLSVSPLYNSTTLPSLSSSDPFYPNPLSTSPLPTTPPSASSDPTSPDPSDSNPPLSGSPYPTSSTNSPRSTSPCLPEAIVMDEEENEEGEAELEKGESKEKEQKNEKDLEERKKDIRLGGEISRGYEARFVNSNTSECFSVVAEIEDKEKANSTSVSIFYSVFIFFALFLANYLSRYHRHFPAYARQQSPIKERVNLSSLTSYFPFSWSSFLTS